MPPTEVNSPDSERPRAPKGKRTIIAIIALIVMALLLAFSVLRPIVDRNDGAEGDVPAVQFPGGQ